MQVHKNTFKSDTNNLSFPYVILNDNKKLSIKIFGDSFVSLLNRKNILAKETSILKSWTAHLSTLFNCRVECYGIRGAGEPTILNMYQQTLKDPRDYTIIFHTHPKRIDFNFNTTVSKDSFRKWDDSLINFPCLHLYWSGEKHYIFKNGKTIYCEFMEPDSESNKGNRINHMTFANNKKFAKVIYDKIKNETVFYSI